MSKVTIKDVAKAANVSMSTVNKALTGKKGISAELKKKILDTVDELGYQTNHIAGSLARKPIRIGIIVPNDWEEYYGDICDGIFYAMKRLRDWKFEGVTLKYSSDEADYQPQVISCIEKFKEIDISSVIFCHNNYFSSAIVENYALENKMKVVCIGLGTRKINSFYTSIEVDSYQCGRIAADMLSEVCGKDSHFAVVIGDKKIFPHNQKVLGFSSICENVEVLESTDEDEKAYNLTKELLAKSDIAGIYIATGIPEGVCRAVLDSDLKNKIKLISTDLSENAKQYLKQDVLTATIYQNTFLQGVMAVNILYDFYSKGTEAQKNIFMPPLLFTKESLFTDQKINLFRFLGDMYTS